MNKKYLYIGFFVIVLLLGIFLRFSQLGKVPDSLDWDEAAWGYNAYTFMHTGKDEFGIVSPVSFKSFGDYKQPIYIYSEIIPIALFGLNSFSVRFPAAIYGSVSIILMFLFVRELFYKTKHKNYFAFLAMTIFAFSPWSIQFSRVAFESTLGVAFVLLGSYLFLLAIRKNSKISFFFAFIAFALSAYSYHSQKLFIPIYAFALFLLNWKYFINKKLLTVCLLLLLFLSNAIWLFNGTTTARGQSVLFTSQQTQLLKDSANTLIYYQSQNDILGIILNNRRIVYARTFALNYLKHFDPNWLFISGDLPRHHAPGMGLLYLASLPFIILGTYFLFRRKFENHYLLVVWFLLAPVASSIAIDAPNAERSVIMLPPIVILEAIGLVLFWQYLKVKAPTIRNALFGIIVLAYVFNIGYYLNQYFSHTNYDTQKYWQYGYEQSILFTKQSKFKNKNVIFSSEFEQPYIFYLFYTKYDPAKYIASGGSNRVNDKCFSIDNHFFGNCEKMLKAGDIFVTLYAKPFKPFIILNTTNFLNGEKAATVYQIK